MPNEIPPIQLTVRNRMFPTNLDSAFLENSSKITPEEKIKEESLIPNAELP